MILRKLCWQIDGSFKVNNKVQISIDLPAGYPLNYFVDVLVNSSSAATFFHHRVIIVFLNHCTAFRINCLCRFLRDALKRGPFVLQNFVFFRSRGDWKMAILRRAVSNDENATAYVHVPKIHEGQQRAVIKRSWGGASIISVKEQRERETRR